MATSKPARLGNGGNVNPAPTYDKPPAPAQAPPNAWREALRADTTAPRLLAARSHLDVAPNPEPAMPSLAGLWGTGAVAAMERLHAALQSRSRAQAEAVDCLRLPAQASAYKADVLAWLASQGA